MFALDEPYRRQLSTTICLIGQIDFPANWPELFTILSNQLNGDDLRSVEAALGAIEQLVHRYRNESKSYELFAEIRIVLEPLAQPLTVLYERMMGHVVNANSLNADQQTQLFEILLLGAKCYQSLLSQDFPAYFEVCFLLFLCNLMFAHRLGSFGAMDERVFHAHLNESAESFNNQRS